MQKLRCNWLISSILMILLASCASTQIAPATPISTDGPADIGVPVIDLNTGNQLIVISSVTGRTLDSFAPISVGTYYSYAFSPDRHTLAITSVGQLWLIDLRSWKNRSSDVGLHGVISSVVYSPNANLVALTSGGPEGYLRIVDASSGEVKAGGAAGFTIRKAQFTADGKALMLYGPQLATSGPFANAGVSTGAPIAALFSAPDLKLLWSVELSGIRDGAFPKKADMANTQDIYQPGVAWRFEPGIAFDPSRDVLYLVHGDTDKLTTVDFSAKGVKTVDIRPHLSWFDRLLSLTAGVAYAKGMDGTTKQAIVSPDGKLLYVIGSTETVLLQPDSNWSIQDTPLGLEVIATADGTRIDKLETTATSAALIPDGQHFILSGWKQKTNMTSTPWADVYELASRRLVKHLDGVNLFPTRRLDGRVILVSSDQISNYKCNVAWVDPATWEITHAREETFCADWLMDR